MYRCRNHGVASALWSIVVSLFVGFVLSLRIYGAPVTLKLLTAGGDVNYQERLNALLREFEKQNPDIKVVVEIDPAGSLDKFLAMVAAGKPPDVIRLYGQWIPECASKGLIQDITDRFKSSEKLDMDDFMPILLRDSLSWKGRIYAIPFGVAVSSFFYNRTMFDEVGVVYPSDKWRWEVEGIRELKKFARDLNGDGKIDRFGLVSSGGGGTSYELYPFFYSAGSGPLFSEDWSKFLGNSPAVRTGLQFLYDLIYAHQIMPPPSQSGGWGDFAAAKAACLMWGSFMVGYLNKLELPFEWDVAVHPTLRGGRGTNIWPETPYAIPVGVKHPELSWRLLEFIGSVEGQKLTTSLGFAIPPVRLSVAKTAFLEKYRNLNVRAFIQMATERLTCVLPTAPMEAKVIFDGAVTDVIYGRKSPGQALDEVTPKIQAVLDKMRKEG